MDDQKLSLLGKILGVLQMVIAVFVLDMNSWNGILVSVLLFLGGVLLLTADVTSTVFQSARRVLSYITILIAVALIIKLFAVH
jgi:hypothetical protein